MAGKNAFTLSEVLITLALLGIIAAFTIPKVLQTTQQQDYKARTQETLSAVVTAVIDWKAKNPTKQLDLSTSPLDNTFNLLEKPPMASAFCPQPDPGNTGLDFNSDGVVDATDANIIINYIRTGGPYNAQYDINADGAVTPLDALIVLNFIHNGGSFTSQACYRFKDNVVVTLSQAVPGSPVCIVVNPQGQIDPTNYVNFAIQADGNALSLGQAQNNPTKDPAWFQ